MSAKPTRYETLGVRRARESRSHGRTTRMYGDYEMPAVWLRQLPLDAAGLVRLDDVALLHVLEVLEDDPALEAFLDLAGATETGPGISHRISS